MRKETKYYHELEDGREVELPFDPEGADITEVQTTGKIILGCIVRDLGPGDPLEEFDGGVCVWEYDKTTLELGERYECWGYYSSEYAEQELAANLETYK